MHDPIKQPPEVTLRPVRPEDSARVHRLVESVLAEFGFGLGHHTEDWDLKNPDEFYAPPESAFLVLEIRGEVMGTVGIKHRSDSEAELRRMYLKPDLRGGGHGKKMLHAALDFARSQGYEIIYLETVEKFEAATALYKRFGFILTDRCAEHCHLVYEKAL